MSSFHVKSDSSSHASRHKLSHTRHAPEQANLQHTLCHILPVIDFICAVFVCFSITRTRVIAVMGSHPENCASAPHQAWSPTHARVSIMDYVSLFHVCNIHIGPSTCCWWWIKCCLCIQRRTSHTSSGHKDAHGPRSSAENRCLPARRGDMCLNTPTHTHTHKRRLQSCCWIHVTHSIFPAFMRQPYTIQYFRAFNVCFVMCTLASVKMK